MEDRYTPTISEEERAARRAQRAAAREKKRRAKRRRQLVLLAPVAVLILAAVGLATAWAHREPEPQEELPEVQPMAFAEEEPEPEQTEEKGFPSQSLYLPESVLSSPERLAHGEND